MECNTRLVHKRLRRLVVHRRQRRHLGEKVLEERGLQGGRVVGNRRLVRKHNALGRLGVRGEQTPVDVAAVAQVGVVALLCCEGEDTLNHLLCLAWLLEEELDRRREELELHLHVLVVERVQELVQQLVGVVDALGILPDDPDHRRLGLRLIERVQVLTQRPDDALVVVGVLAEDVLDHHDGLLHHVVDLGLDELQQHVDAALRRLVQLDGAPSNGTHAPTDKLDVDLGGVLLELHQHLVHVALRRQHDHDLQLLHLDVDGVVVLAEEHLDLPVQDRRSLLNDEVDVAECHVLNFRLGGEERHERRGELAGERARGVGIGDDLHVLEHDLDGGEHDGGVGMLQTGHDTVDDALSLTRIARCVPRQRIQDEHLAPLSALVQGGKELLKGRRGHLEDIPLRVLCDFGERRDRVGHNHRVRIGEEVF
mmetsp:Transcript_37558/g.81412  ORF Transcript_37558/g.81412 Transcript_37558/m.81412 type:complete len:424 (-) Transcript_37558:321-1592(-)